MTLLDVYHTVIDFDGHGLRRFVTNRVVVERTDDPGPTPSERRAIVLRRAKEERARVKAAALVEKVPVPSRRRRAKPDPEDAPAPAVVETPVETLAEIARLDAGRDGADLRIRRRGGCATARRATPVDRGRRARSSARGGRATSP